MMGPYSQSINSTAVVRKSLYLSSRQALINTWEHWQEELLYLFVFDKMQAMIYLSASHDTTQYLWS